MPRHLQRHRRPALRAALPAAALVGIAVLAACDNVGRVFDRTIDPTNPGGPTVTSSIQVPPDHGDVRDGRPLVRATYPRGGGWPDTVVAVVEFSESINEATVLPTTPGGTDAKIVIRPSGTTVALPALYDFLAGGRLLVVRPITALSSPQQSTFDIVQLPGIRDTDGIRFSSNAEEILATFTVDTQAAADGKILALFPRDNARDVARDTDLVAVFTRPVTGTLVNLVGNFVVRPQGGTAILGTPAAPLVSTTTGLETRVLTFRPLNDTPYAASTTHEIVVNSNITFANDGVLDFSGRTPFARFTTAGVPSPDSVVVDNITTGFADKVNRSNLQGLILRVAVPAETAVGDRVLARVYGSDKQTTATGDLAFVERTVDVAAGGANDVTLDFSGLLGQLGRERFDDGALSFTAQLLRGAQHSGVVRGSTDAAQDTVAPTIVSVGPPVGPNGTDLYCELEDVALFGVASERVAAASMVIGTNTTGLYGSAADGRFLLEPNRIGRPTGSVTWSLNVRDAAGNETAAPTGGQVFQRGLLTGTASSGTLIVEAYDEATLRPLANVAVVVDPGVPTLAATGRLVGATDATGRAVFTPPPSTTTNTITLVLAGYDLVTLYDSPVGFASLPMRPTGAAASTAAFVGAATMADPVAGARVAVGSNLFADPTALSVVTSLATPTVIPRTDVLPNRPQMITALAGTIEPTATPTFAERACTLVGLDLLATAPPVPAAVGGTSTLALNLRATASVSALSPIGNLEQGRSLGINTGSLIGPALVRFQVSLRGISGQGMIGLGFPEGAPTMTISGSFSKSLFDRLAPFSPTLWAVTQLQDTAGIVSRTRARINDQNGSSQFQVEPQQLHTLETGAVTTQTNPPMIELVDAIDVAQVFDANPSAPNIPGLVGVYELDLQAGSGRHWRVLAEDTDGNVFPAPLARTYQLPPDAGTGASLPVGTWTLRSFARLFDPGTGTGAAAAHDFVLAERLRTEVAMTRVVIDYTIN